MSVSSNALITLAELQTYPGIPSSLSAVDTTILEALIDAVSKEIDNWTGITMIQQSFIEHYLWEHIKDRTKFRLRHFPIVSVTSITDLSSNTIASTEYWIDKVFGFLVRAGAWQVPQDDNGFATYWTIVYTAGKFANTAAVDAAVKLACKMQVGSMYRKPDPSVVTKTVDDLSLTFATGEDKGEYLLAEVRNILRPYKGMRFV